MTPSWNNLRHPFASSSNSSAGPSTRERRTSKGYEESDFLPPPPPSLASTGQSRDSGRFSDAAGDESVDPGSGGGDMPDFTARWDRPGGDGGSRQRDGVNTGYGVRDGQVGSSRTRYTESGRYTGTDSTSSSGLINNPHSDYAPYQSPNQPPYYPSRQYSSNNPPSSLSPSQSFPYAMEQYPSASQGYAESPRDRLPSSASYNSMSASVRGRRAPAPAPLDLSPRSEKVRREAAGLQGEERYTGLGLGMPMSQMEGQGRRVLTDSSLHDHSTRSRPLPQPPQPVIHARSTSITHIPYSYAREPTNDDREHLQRTRFDSTTESSTSHISTSPSMPLGVPLSAVGQMDRKGVERRASANTLSTVTGGTGGRPSTDTTRIDSYYLTSYPSTQPESEPYTPTMPNTPFAPITPGLPDPSTLDRRGLVGTGELATPRWASTTLHQHMRTPSMPQAFGVSPDLPSTSAPTTSSATSRNWSHGASGFGLGVGVMEGVKEESPQKYPERGIGHRARALSQQGIPAPKVTEQSLDRYPTGSATLSRGKGLDTANLLDLGEFGDFQFDSSMEAAIAASLSIPDEPDFQATQPESVSAGSGRVTQSRFPETLRSAPLPPMGTTRFTSIQQAPEQYPQFTQQQSEQFQPGIPISPGSARSRIYARRQEREKRNSLLAQSSAQPLPSLPLPPPPMQPDSIPLRSSSKYTPPNSAHSNENSGSGQRSTRDARKTPPVRDATPRANKHSPSSSHDILKHFAPRDFSHLPPSPSSASINQFLKNSSSANNFSSLTSPGVKTPPASSSGGYFPSSPSGPPPLPAQTPQKSGIQRSDSQRSQKMKGLAGGRAQKEGWEIDAETAEAMRKLDGLGGTPGRSKSGVTSGAKSKLSSGPSRPGTPPTVKREDKGKGSMLPRPRLAERASYGSLAGDHGSPLTDWAQLAAEDIQPTNPVRRTVNGVTPNQLDRPHIPIDKRRSSSSASFIGTPTSRDSHTSATTPPSTAGLRPDGKGRRASGGSEVSASSDSAPGVNGSYEKIGEVSVPPVPPLPKGYISMRQGLAQAASTTPAPSYVPLQSPSDGISPTGTPPSDPIRPKPSSKKWSFSSAMSLKLNSPSQAPSSSPPIQGSTSDSPETGWSEVHHAELVSPQPPLNRLGSDSSSYTLNTQAGVGRDTRSNASLTPVGNLLPTSTSAIPKPLSSSTSNNKRLTPSSIPFFRRSSSSSFQLQPQQQASKQSPPVPETPKSSMPPPSKIPAAPTSARKSMLGMHLPSMLRGSTSKRHLSQQLETQVENQEVVEVRQEEKAATIGWKGRQRGKTLSISGPLQPRKASLAPDQQQATDERSSSKSKASGEGSLNQRPTYTTNASSESQTLRPSRSGLPPISGSPSIRAVPSSSSLRSAENRAPSTLTPTKIPRLVSRDSDSPAYSSGTMGPPALPHTMTNSRIPQAGPVSHNKTMSSNATMERTGISEFGAVGGGSALRMASLDPQRSRLLAPMSMRNEPKPRVFAKQIDTTRTERPANVPPSRRNMPLPPRSSATAMTISAQNKRASRDVIPGMSRTSSKESGRESSETSTPNPNYIKPSKSLHSNLVAPKPTAIQPRIPSSSSVGAPGSSYRKTSLVSDSPADSPAEDEETLADAEMMAYVERRKARVAAGSKKDDLADIEEFPDDIEPKEPISQRTYISKNLASMSDFERKEVLDYDKIYFTPTKKIRRDTINGAIYNHGYDDDRGDYIVVDGDHMCYRYEVIKILGKGSFGQVAQCRDHKTGGSVAVKIIRNKKRFHAQALVEVKILGQLVDWDPEDKHHMVRMTDHFYFRSHLCIVTELLSINLYELIKANQFAGFSTTVIRRFTMQMLASMQLMRSHRIVHCDLKPENILLTHPCKSGIKVIDFGSSCHEAEKVYTYIQSRFYRSPEVILGMNYAMAIDMWSLGCILAELYTGVPIFPGENEHEQLACIMEILGVPDRDIVNRAQRKKLFFDATGAPRPFVNAKGKRRRPATRTLAQVLKCKDELFVDFIAKCLTWDPDRRLKPQPAMRHPWILQGKRRYAPAPPVTNHDRRTSEQSGSYVAAPTKSMATAMTRSNDKKQLIISPPTPLVARVAPVPASAPRMGQASANIRGIPQSVTSRNSAYMNPARVGNY